MFAIYMIAGIMGIAAFVGLAWILFAICAYVVERVLDNFPISHKVHDYDTILSILLALLTLVASYFVGRWILN